MVWYGMPIATDLVPGVVVSRWLVSDDGPWLDLVLEVEEVELGQQGRRDALIEALQLLRSPPLLRRHTAHVATIVSTHLA